MARSSQVRKDGMETIHLDPAVWSALAAAASAAHMHPDHLANDILRASLNDAVDNALHREAERQSRLLAAVAADPDSDEAAVMRILDAQLLADDFKQEWTA